MKLFFPIISGLVLLFTPDIAFAQQEATRLNESIAPKDDFYQHVNGIWMATTEIPETEGIWASYSELIEHNQAILRKICEKAASEKNPKGSDNQLVGDFYYAAMDSVRIQQLGFEALRAPWDKFGGIQTKEQVVEAMATNPKTGLPSPIFTGASIDAKNSRYYALHMMVGGTTLPSRDYYISDNPRFEQIRQDYVQHIREMMQLAGLDAEEANHRAAKILEMETRLAIGQRSRVQMRDPQKRYNKLSMDDLRQMTFSVDWDQFFKMRGIENPEFVITSAPESIAMLDRMLDDFSPKDWSIYFQWKLLNSGANYLSTAFVEKNFDFFSKKLRGIQEIQPRWKRMQRLTDGSLGEPLGKLFVQKAFPPEAKARMITMIEDLRAAFRMRIRDNQWMSEETKSMAIKKLDAITYKIGYPDQWKDYSGLDIRSDDFLGNLKRIAEFEDKKNLAKLGKEVDPNEWGMSPPTVNAYYSPLLNEIVFPAGILQPPFFDFNAEDAINYGAIGAVIGHEITHGFDDSGSQYDADGNLSMWWTKEDREAFEKLSQKIVAQYDSYMVLDSIPVNGKLTLGENIADLGGLVMAYDALQHHFNKVGRPGNMDGLTPEQRFFIGFARIWRVKHRDQVLLERIKTDSHSPGYYRCNGTLSNTPEFHQAFGVKEGDKMMKPEIIRIW